MYGGSYNWRWIKAEQNVMRNLSHLLEFGLLNPQSVYIKIDAYLLQILCHMIFDVKLSHCFLLSKVKNMFLTFKSFRKQCQSNKQKLPLLACRKTSTVKYTLNSFNFQFSFVYHKVWIVMLVDFTTNIFLCFYFVLFLYFHFPLEVAFTTILS